MFVALVGVATFGQGHQQVGDTGRGGENHQADIGIRKYHVGAAVHRLEIGHAGAAEFGYYGCVLGCCLSHVKPRVRDAIQIGI
ncbi:hypothetical protein D3C76_1595590 [compost metagenome]